jgi:hypothetical protein
MPEKHFMRHDLLMNDLEPTIICCSCKSCLCDFLNTVTKHLTERYSGFSQRRRSWRREKRWQLSRVSADAEGEGAGAPNRNRCISSLAGESASDEKLAAS